MCLTHFTNILLKESLNSDGLYNSTNINKTNNHLSPYPTEN